MARGSAASSVVTVISTRLQVERITASATPSRDFRSASAAGSVSSRKARHSRTSTGAVLWLTPVISSFMVCSMTMPSRACAAQVRAEKPSTVTVMMAALRPRHPAVVRRNTSAR